MQVQPGRNRGVFEARTLRHAMLCREHFLLILQLERFPASKPGQFVQLQCRDLSQPEGAREVAWSQTQPPKLTQSELAEDQPLLRRPFSLAGRRDGPEGVELDIIYRVVGRGTDWLSRLKAGDRLSILGPLGNSFGIDSRRPQAALVGGGVGIPPMIYLAEALHEAGREITVFLGAQSRDLLPMNLLPGAETRPPGQPAPLLEPFAPYQTRDVLATDDGSLGRKGFVTDAMKDWLDKIPFDPSELVVYTCGPEPMMKAVANICTARSIACQVSMERSMGCGMGTCQSCICKTRAENERGWAYKLCCTDGPVFDAEKIIWS